MMKTLDFRPLKGLASPHLQMFFATFMPPGAEPPSTPLIITLPDNDRLSCQVSTPPEWKPDQTTIVVVHGLGGSHRSVYMIRLARKFYQQGCRVVRVNFRGCGSGEGLNSRPYYGGNSDDIWEVIRALKASTPHSPLNLIGFSLGGSAILKMAGEKEEQASQFVNRMIAICPPLDLAHTLSLFSQGINRFYHNYYLKNVLEQTKPWTTNLNITSAFDFDQRVVAPHWGYAGAQDYYQRCSAVRFIPRLRIPCEILLSNDDPFVDHKTLQGIELAPQTQVTLTNGGSHLGFIGRTENRPGFYWLDNYLLDWNKNLKDLTGSVVVNCENL